MLIKSNFNKVVKTKSRIKGLMNESSGYTFSKTENTYHLYWMCGNGIYRGMSIEEQDKKTEEIFKFLIANGFSNYVQLGYVLNRKRLLLMNFDEHFL